MANEYLVENEIKPVPMILSSPRYNVGERVSTTYGNGWVRSFDPVADLYKVDVDWRGLDVQIKEYKEEKEGMSSVADNDTTQASVDVSRVKSDESNTDEPSQPPAPSGDMSVRSISPPPSSIAHDNDSTSAPDSELAFYRNVASLDAHLVDAAHTLLADGFDEAFRIVAESADDLPAIARVSSADAAHAAADLCH